MTPGRPCLVLVMVVSMAMSVAQSTATQVRTSKILVAVADRSWRPVSNLQAADFSVDRGPGEYPVLNVVPSREPPTLVFIVDGFAASQVPSVQRALDDAMALWRAQVGGRVGGVAGSVGDTRARLANVSSARAGVDSFRPLLPMPQSLEVAAGALRNEASRRRAIVAVNLGTPIISSTIDRLRSVMQEANTQVWSVSVQPQGQAGPLQNAGESARLLAELAEESGGIRDTIFSVSGLSDSLSRMVSLILSEYEVSFDNAGRPADSIRVRVHQSDFRAVATWWPLH
jgi:hypothetical protein